MQEGLVYGEENMDFGEHYESWAHRELVGSSGCKQIVKLKYWDTLGCKAGKLL